jgi:hypothetical protein
MFLFLYSNLFHEALVKVHDNTQRVCIMATTAAAMTATSAQAAEIDIVLPTAVSITGDITPTSYDEWTAKVSSLQGPHTVFLWSYGGNLLAALQIGEFIRMRGWNSAVLADCYCSCALIWLAGSSKWMLPEAHIGFHVASLNGQESGHGSAMIGGYLTRIGYDYNVVSFATQAGPQEVSLLTPQAAKFLGINVAAIELPAPAQSAPPTQAATPAPPAQRPEDQVTALTNAMFESANRGEVLDRWYADRVDYYGKLVSKQDIIADKLEFNTRWPVHHNRPTTLNASCQSTDSGSGCLVSGAFDWDSANTTAHRKGTGTFRYAFSEINGAFLVVLEDSTVTSRREAFSESEEQTIADWPANDEERWRATAPVRLRYARHPVNGDRHGLSLVLSRDANRLQRDQVR